MNALWNAITHPDHLQKAIEASFDQPVVIFKHSYRCSISLMAAQQMRRLETDTIGRYFIDVITDRSTSLALAQLSGVQHESPQALLYYKGQLFWNGSHGQVTADVIQSRCREVEASAT